MFLFMDNKENYTPKEVAKIADAYRSLYNADEYASSKQIDKLETMIPENVAKHLKRGTKISGFERMLKITANDPINNI